MILWQEMNDVEQESLSGGIRKVEVIVRPFSLTEATRQPEATGKIRGTLLLGLLGLN